MDRCVGHWTRRACISLHVFDAPQAGCMHAAACVPTCTAAAEGLELLSGPTGGEAVVRSYAIKCLFNTHPEKVCEPWLLLWC
jgi:hypothetical protein